MVNKVDLYKQFYNKELAVKTELNNAVNLPIGVFTAIVSLHVYLFSKTDYWTTIVISWISAVTLLFTIICLYYLNKSYFNMGQSFYYAELTDMKQFYDYSIQLKGRENEDGQFESHLEEQLAICASKNFAINKARTKDLAKTKIYLFYGVVLSFTSSIIYIVSLITK